MYDESKRYDHDELYENEALDSEYERKGDFIDFIFYCPYEIHELVTDGDM